MKTSEFSISVSANNIITAHIIGRSVIAYNLANKDKEIIYEFKDRYKIKCEVSSGLNFVAFTEQSRIYLWNAIVVLFISVFQMTACI